MLSIELRCAVSQNEELQKINLTLNSGMKDSIFLTIEQSKEFVEVCKKNGLFVTYSGEEVYIINPNSIAISKLQNTFSDQQELVQIIDVAESDKEEDSLSKAYEKALGWFRIECKCGSTYEVKLPEERTKAGCRVCNEMVLADKIDGKIKLDNGEGYLMTNKKYVDRSYIERLK
jgi:hypothetical protein